MTRPAPHRARGFTLIELLVVVMLLGVLAMTASSAWAESGTYRLDLVQRQVADAVDFAVARSRSTREAHGVVFDVSTERFAVVDESGAIVRDPLSQGDYIVDFRGPQYPRGIDLVQANFATGGVALVVDPEGEAMSTGSVEFTYAGDRRTMTVDRATCEITGS